MAVVRRARSEDAAALAAVHIAAWRAAYRGVMPDDFLDGLDHGRRTAWWQGILGGPAAQRAFEAVFVGEIEGGRVAGFALTGPERAAPARAETWGELWAINVVPEQWGQGVGRLLLGAAEQALLESGYRQAVLWVVAANDRARRFYERAGWQADGADRRDWRLGFELHEVRYARRLEPGPTPRA